MDTYFVTIKKMFKNVCRMSTKMSAEVSFNNV